MSKTFGLTLLGHTVDCGECTTLS